MTLPARLAGTLLGLLALTGLGATAAAAQEDEPEVRTCTLFIEGKEAYTVTADCTLERIADHLLIVGEVTDYPAPGPMEEDLRFGALLDLNAQTGFLSAMGAFELADGPVTIAENARDPAALAPGPLAVWPNGYVLELLPAG